MAIIFLGLLGAAALIVVSVIVLIATIDLKPFLEQYVAKTLDRRLSIGALRIRWGDPLSVEISDVRLANAPWGSAPAMAHIERLSAEIDLSSIFSGVLRFVKLDVVKPEIILERDTDGIGNWRFGGAASPSPAAATIVPKNRPRSSRVPTLIDFQIHDGSVTFRTFSGAVLRIDLRDLMIRSVGQDEPVNLALVGAYNGAPVQLSAETQSFSTLRHGTVPFGVEFSASTPTAKVDFKGTMMDPLNFDGVQGPLQIDARLLGDLLNTVGADAPADFPLLIAGDFTRTEDHWQLSNAKGKVANSAFEGALTLTEASLGKPDDIGIAANFVQLDLNPILADDGKGKTGNRRRTANSDYGALPLGVEAKRGTNFEAQIKAKELIYRAMHIADFGVDGRLASGEVAVSQLSFAFAGGRVDASGSAQNAPPGSHVVGNATISGAAASQIAGLLGAEVGQIAGKINGRVTLEMTGETVKQAFKKSRGHAVLTMTEGRIARALLEKVSADLRSLFRKDESSAQISCLLGVINMQNGQGTVLPFRLKTPETTLVGGGQVDFLGERLDVIIKSEATSTGIFALDIPLRISGPFAHLGVKPAIGSSAGWLHAPTRNNLTAELPPGTQKLANSNPCSR